MYLNYRIPGHWIEKWTFTSSIHIVVSCFTSSIHIVVSSDTQQTVDSLISAADTNGLGAKGDAYCTIIIY